MAAAPALPLDDVRVFVHPGKLAASAAPCRITTILGSCIAVSLHDPTAGVGGINHFLLPRAPHGEQSARFGDQALPQLLDAVERLGARRAHLVAKVVGGACVLDVFRDKLTHLGNQNASMAFEALHDLKLPVLMAETGGRKARHVTFYPHTGDLVVRSL
ncbi:MAG TPA: chemotaxis protein CheD [Gemmatimonadales bacterium]|nr:chemotaxis protein CheD [Gemmatimonadales bacterium]